MNKDWKTENWKIISINHKPVNIEYTYVLNEGLERYSYLKGFIGYGKGHTGFYTINWEINSIQRLSDHTIFSIGDEVRSSKFFMWDGSDKNAGILKIEKIVLNGKDIFFEGKQDIRNNSMLLENAKMIRQNILAPTALTPEQPIINKQKQTGMKVVIKENKKIKKEMSAGSLIYNKVSGYHAIIAKNSGVGTTIKVLIINVDDVTKHSTIEQFRYLDANKNDCELFEGTITLENEK